MSTRRARIKAVATLPVRRKNAVTKPKTPVPKSPQSGNEIQCTDNSDDIIETSLRPQESEAATILSKTCLDHEKVSVITTTAPKTDSRDTITSEDHTSKTLVSQEPDAAADLIHTVIEKRAESIASVRHGRGSPAETAATCEASIQYRLHNPNSNTTISVAKKQEAVQNACSGQNVTNLNVTQKLKNVGGASAGSEAAASPDAMVDGIVPLSSAGSRAVELLKSEIISESAEVLFDPIVPLPSPGKLRPKLRPAPRLATVRRSSVQGSASESEDEHKRALLGAAAGRTRRDSQSSLSTHHSLLAHVRESGRSRNDSVCSVVSHAATAVAASPLKEKHLLSRSKRSESSRLSAARRRQRARGAGVARDQLTMYDLIYYNPTTNPILESEEEKKHVKKVEEKGAEESEGDEESEGEETEAVAAAEGEGVEQEPTPVPQIKLGPDGEIIIDEKSLVIQQTESGERLSASVVQETEWERGGAGPGGRYSRTPRTKQWPDDETVRFYRALGCIGTDFSLMIPLFPDRSRRDLKTKFKKEERLNSAQVERALAVRGAYKLQELMEEFALEREEAAQRKRDEAQRVLLAREQERLDREQVRRLRVHGTSLGRMGKSALEILPVQKSLLVSTPEDIIAHNLLGPPQAQKRKSDTHTQSGLKAVPRKVAIAASPHVQRKPSPKPFTPPAKPSAFGKYASFAQTYELPANVNPLSIAKNVAPGSLVCLTIPDPNDPSKKVLQTYISDGKGKMTAVDLPPAMLSSVMEYMKGTSPSCKNTPQPHKSQNSSPASSASGGLSARRRSEEGAEGGGGSVAPLQPLPHPPSPTATARVRHNSYTIMNL